MCTLHNKTIETIDNVVDNKPVNFFCYPTQLLNVQLSEEHKALLMIIETFNRDDFAELRLCNDDYNERKYCLS